MSTRSCSAFDWTEAFDKFGFGDGDDDVFTHKVAMRLSAHGYTVTAQAFGLHNRVITSILLDGVEQIPGTTNIGYDDPHQYLPPAIIALLDAKREVPS